MQLEQKIRQAVLGALNRNEHSPIPSASRIDWKWTIGRNLKNYNAELQTIIPERVYFYSRAQRSHNWTVIVDMDQSGSMADVGGLRRGDRLDLRQPARRWRRTSSPSTPRSWT